METIYCMGVMLVYCLKLRMNQLTLMCLLKRYLLWKRLKDDELGGDF